MTNFVVLIMIEIRRVSMRKFNRVFLSLALLLLTTFSFGACCFEIKKTAITGAFFQTTMEEKGYSVTVDSESDDYICYIASNGNQYSIEFYEFLTDYNANKMYLYVEGEMEEDSGSGTTATLSGTNYDKYESTDSVAYRMVCRVDNTVMLVEVDKTYKNTVVDLIKSLGY